MTQYDRERAAKEQDAYEAMIRMRTPVGAKKSKPLPVPRGDVLAQGPFNGMGEPDRDGSYVHLIFAVDTQNTQRMRISRGQAELLSVEIHNILSFDLDKITGSVIDAYTLAPNDEDEKRIAVRVAIERGIGRLP